MAGAAPRERHPERKPGIHVDPSGIVRGEFMAWLPRAVADEKVLGFVTTYGVDLVDAAPDHYRMQIGQQESGGWFCLKRGCTPLAIELQINRSTPCVRSLTRISVEIGPADNGPPQDDWQKRAVRIMEVLRDFMMSENLEQRAANRTSVSFPVLVCPLDSRHAEPDWDSGQEAVGRDFSKTGIAFTADEHIPTKRVYLEYYVSGSAGVVCATGEIVREEPAENGRLTYGVRLHEGSLRLKRSYEAGGNETQGDDEPDQHVLRLGGDDRPKEGAPRAKCAPAEGQTDCTLAC
ncbi:MAG: PilZ domain-containing protein [Pirellulales bacterium]